MANGDSAATALIARLTLLMLNLVLLGLGIALCVLGSNEDGTAGLIRAIYAEGGLTMAAFQKPDVALAVSGAFIICTSLQGCLGSCTGSKRTLFTYHTMCLFLLAGVIFCAEMMRAYKDEAGATVASYWRRLDPTDMSSKDDALDGYDEARTAKIARRWFLAANGILAAAAVFLSLSLLVSGSLMGLKYTVKRVGSGVNFAGCIFGFFLLALCAIVARTTYRVPDAVSLDVEVDFPYGDHRQSDAMLEFDRTLHETPWKIFQDDPPPRPHGLDPTTPPAPSPLPSSNETALSTPPPPPPPSPPWNAAFPARAMWINHEQHSRRRVHGEINSTVVHFTVSFAGVNASADVDLNATLPPVVKARVEEFARNESSVVVKNIRPGAKHGIGGAWTAHLLAAVGAVTVISSAAGFIGVTGGSIGALLVHLFFCAVTFVMAVVGAHLVTDHADDTKAYIGDHWREIQTGLVGEDVAAEDAGAFASQHMRAAAALGAITCVILGVSAGCSFTALLAINGAFDRGARRGAYRGVSRGAPRHRELVDEESESDEYDDDGWGDDGWGDGWGDAGRDDDDGEVLVAEKRANRRVRTSTRGGGGVRRDAAARRRAENGSGMSPSGSGSRVGDAVLEMTDLAKMVGEARGGRGRFKSRGGKSSRTPSPEPEVERRSSRESSPQRKARLAREKAAAAKTPAARMDESLLSLLSRVTGGIKTANGIGGGFTAASDGRRGGESGTSVFRDEIARPGHTREEVAAAVSMLREAAARRNPDDPEAALRAALEVAGEGDASLIREALGKNFSIPRPGRDAEFTLE